MNKLITIIVLELLAVSFITVLPIHGAVISSSVSSTTLTQTTTPQNSTFNPSSIPNYHGIDKGNFGIQTNINNFVWSKSPTDSMTINLPIIGGTTMTNSFIFVNSTHTSYQFTGTFGSANLFFKVKQDCDSLTARTNCYQIKVSINVNFISPQTFCLPFSSTNPIIQKSINSTLLAAIKSGSEVFSWFDIPSIDSPTFSSNQLCMNLPMGITNIDPLALDGTGSCSAIITNTCNATLTTTTINDIIIVYQGCFSGGGCGGYSISDTSGLTWNLRLCRGSDGNTCASVNGFDSVAEYYAISAGILAGDTITGTQTGNVNGRISIVVFGISGANTASPFDSNAAVPCSNDNGGAISSTFSCPTISTSNANDIIFAGSSSSDTVATHLQNGAGFNIAICNGLGSGDSAGSACAEYFIFAATQTNLAIQITSTGNQHWAFIGDAIKQSAGVNQPVLLTLLVNPSPNPDGGMILKGATLTTISSSTVITIATSASTTFTITAQEFSAYIWFGWSGITTYIQDTINPTQTVAVTSWTNTTLSQTLTASFKTASSGATDIDTSLIIILAVVFMLLVVMRIQRSNRIDK